MNNIYSQIVPNAAPFLQYLPITGIWIYVKVQVTSLKTYQPTSYFSPWLLDLFIRVPFQLHGEHTALQPFRRIEV